MTDQTNPFLIPPPPPPAPQQESQPDADAPDGSADRPDPSAPLITLPPGLVDSATHRLGSRPAKRPVSPAAAATDAPAPVRRSADDIVFFPAPPGAVVKPPAPTTAVPTTPAPATAGPTAARTTFALPTSAPMTPTTPAPPRGADVSDATVVRPTGSAASWRLTLPDGETVDLATTMFVGRNPAVTPEWAGADLLPISDPAKSVSKTHALLEIADGRLWVHDLDSTNGVWLSVDGADDIQVSPGDRVAVPPGANLELGEFVIQVEHSGR